MKIDTVQLLDKHNANIIPIPLCLLDNNTICVEIFNMNSVPPDALVACKGSFMCLPQGCRVCVCPCLRENEIVREQSLVKKQPKLYRHDIPLHNTLGSEKRHKWAIVQTHNSSLGCNPSGILGNSLNRSSRDGVFCEANTER